MNRGSNVIGDTLVVICIFSSKQELFRNFRDVSTSNTPKINFYCIFINKFPKNFEKGAQKFFAASSTPQKTRFRRLRRRKRVEIPQFFYPRSVEITPLFEGSSPQKNPSGRYVMGAQPSSTATALYKALSFKL